jgi:hypothetical protein
MPNCFADSRRVSSIEDSSPVTMLSSCAARARSESASDPARIVATVANTGST